MYRSIFIICFSCMSLVGCNHGPETFPVSGTVTYAGKPLEDGAIIFVPDSSNINAAIPSEALIRDGKYKIEKKFGVTQGRYHITVDSTEVILPKTPNGETGYRPRFRSYSMQHDFEAEKNEYNVSVDVPKK